MSDIRTWLDGLELGEYAEVFEAEKVTLATLPELTDGELKELGLPLGPRKALLKAVRESAAESGASPAPAAAQPHAAERRQITVMFCDLVGSTALSERLDPEDLHDLMAAYQKAAGAVIERYDGHVAQYLGDGLMTYFGWPRAHEDDAQRAVRSGLEIIEAVTAVNQAPAPLQVRIGIATGAVVVGETGAGDASVPKAAIGETPNVAARVQGLAEPNTVTIAESTRRLIGGAFEQVDLGAHDMKGVSAAMTIYRVVGESGAETRFDADHVANLTDLVGRDRELATLMSCWQRRRRRRRPGRAAVR